jgi:hypothetical protein
LKLLAGLRSGSGAESVVYLCQKATAALQDGNPRGMSHGCRQLFQACCMAVDTMCGTGLWDRAQQLWRQAAQEARGLPGGGAEAAIVNRALLLGWQRRRDVLLPQLEFVVRVARRYRLVGSAAGAADAVGAGAPHQGPPQGVPMAAVERDVALSLVRCTNPRCTSLGGSCGGSSPDGSTALRLPRCRGCSVAGYCGWVAPLCRPGFCWG